METTGVVVHAMANSFKIPHHILDDLCARFVINVPEEESRDPIRLLFQVELAHWFYLDFYCPENSELRPCSIKEFATQVFRHCPSLFNHAGEFDTILESWKEYKMTVPTYGAILLDPTLQFCLLVQGYWVKASWGFPKGKVNQDEAPVDCAIREVLEETGFDISELINQEEFLECCINEQLSRLYIVPGVPLGTKFQAKTRNEIKNFEWFHVDHLPTHKKDSSCKQLGLTANSFFMVMPFVKNLRRWIAPKAVTVNSVVPDASMDSKWPATPQTQRVFQVTEYQSVARDSKRQSASPRHHVTSSSSAGPQRPAQTLKRDDTKAEHKLLFTSQDSSRSDCDKARRKSKRELYTCQAWTSFRLDIDAVMNAMFSTSSSVQ